MQHQQERSANSPTPAQLTAVDASPDEASPSGWRTPANLAIIAVTTVALLGGLYWMVQRLSHVVVLDARIAADMILISSRVPGWVTDVPVEETQRVRAGDVLLEIDSRYAQLAVDELEARLAALDAQIEASMARRQLVDQQTATHLEVTRSRLGSARAELAAAESTLEMARADWDRAGPLLERNVLTQQEWEANRNAFRVAQEAVARKQAELVQAQAEVAEAEAARAELAVLEHGLERLRAERERARIELQRARSELADHRIKSPIDGIVDQLFVDPGEYVSAAQRVMLLHDPEHVWVKANVKETDLRHLDIGKPVKVAVDALPGETFSGRISRIGGAATSQFALLPNANPAGNFTKITQRVEVNVDLERSDDRLRPGMMVVLEIAK